MKFREHRGQLEDSLETMVELADNDALWAHIRNLLRPYDFEVTMISTILYLDKPDERIGWPETYIVKVAGYGVIGFTDEIPKEA
jgi:hypothetical protein